MKFWYSGVVLSGHQIRFSPKILSLNSVLLDGPHLKYEKTSDTETVLYAHWLLAISENGSSKKSFSEYNLVCK